MTAMINVVSYDFVTWWSEGRKIPWSLKWSVRQIRQQRKHDRQSPPIHVCFSFQAYLACYATPFDAHRKFGLKRKDT